MWTQGKIEWHTGYTYSGGELITDLYFSNALLAGGTRYAGAI